MVRGLHPLQFGDVELAVVVGVQAVELGGHVAHELLFGDAAALVGVHQDEELLGLGLSGGDGGRGGGDGLRLRLLLGCADGSGSASHSDQRCDGQGDEISEQVCAHGAVLF